MTWKSVPASKNFNVRSNEAKWFADIYMLQRPNAVLNHLSIMLKRSVDVMFDQNQSLPGRSRRATRRLSGASLPSLPASNLIP